MRKLDASYNELDSLILDSLPGLKVLLLRGNNLKSLDLSKLPNLEEFEAFENELTQLNVSNNLNLKEINCYDNDITFIDFSHNIKLAEVTLFDNNLNGLNIKNGNNTSITHFDTEGNPDLACIQVDDPDFSAANWTVDATSEFKTDCGFSSANRNGIAKNYVKVSPNPTRDLIHFSGSYNARLSEIFGNTLVLIKNQSEMDISGLRPGVYILQIYQTENDKLISSEKVVKY